MIILTYNAFCYVVHSFSCVNTTPVIQNIADTGSTVHKSHICLTSFWNTAKAEKEEINTALAPKSKFFSFKANADKCTTIFCPCHHLLLIR